MALRSVGSGSLLQRGLEGAGAEVLESYLTAARRQAGGVARATWMEAARRARRRGDWANIWEEGA